MPVLENGARCECETIAPLPACLPPVSRLSPSKGKVFEGCAVARHNSRSRLDRL
ncbi:hypothetical protein [Microcoleus sp. B5-D4]|uniref:hypothetical protein n=1 Tax=Microcoleus sp. B5-D4 TaxID=2818681 RepID=UPI002FCEB879